MPPVSSSGSGTPTPAAAAGDWRDSYLESLHESEQNDPVNRDLVAAFGGRDEEGSGCRTYAAKTPAELSALLEDPDFKAPRPGLRFVEVYMPRDDAPAALKLTAAASARNNAKMEP